MIERLLRDRGRELSIAGMREFIGGFNFLHEMVMEARTNPELLKVVRQLCDENFEVVGENFLEMVDGVWSLDILSTEDHERMKYWSPLHLACASASTPHETSANGGQLARITSKLGAFSQMKCLWYKFKT